MAAFQYVAIDGDGKEVHGSVEATDSRAVAGMLKGRSLFVVSIHAATPSLLSTSMAAGPSDGSSGPAMTRRISLGRLLPVRTRDRVVFFRQMALMLRSGLTLLQALDVAHQQTRKSQLLLSIKHMAEQVRTGRSFAESMRAQRGLFSKFVVNVVASAEASGDMDATFDRIAIYLEQQASTRRNLLSSLFYPSVVVSVGVAIFVFLVGWVIPKFAKFLTQRGVPLPWTTQALIDVSDFLQRYGLVILGVLITVGAGLAVLYTLPSGRRVFDRAVLRVPVIGGVLTIGAVANMSRTLSMLLHSGVTLLESLRITSNVVNNRAISQSISGAAERILKGESLSQGLQYPVIPLLVNHAVAVGERSGSLVEVLHELSKFFDDDLQIRVKRMSTMVEPLMILIVGGMVGFVYIAFFQAIFLIAAT